MGTKIMIFNLLLLTATMAMLLGAYYQHDGIFRNLRQLIQTNPYAFHLRQDIYNCVSAEFSKGKIYSLIS